MTPPRTWTLAGVLAALLLAPAAAQPVDWKERLRAGGKPITWEQVRAKAKAARLVFMGEQHGTKEHHRLQAELLTAMAEEGPVVLACEYFPRSLQPLLDRFNRGEVPLEGFAKHVDWEQTWGFPYEAYRPLFEAAKKTGATILAMNQEKALVAKVRKVGFKGLSWEELLRLPTVDLSREDHRKQSMAALQRVHPMPPEMLERYYEAFTLWDDTMADSVCAQLLRDRRAKLRVLVVAGRAHIEGGVGIPDRVTRRVDLPRLIVVGSDEDPLLGDVVLAPAPPPAEVVRHELRVELFPEERRARVTDRILLRGAGQLDLKLAPEIDAIEQPTVHGGDAGKLPVLGEREGERSLRVSREGQLAPEWVQVTYTLRYEPLRGSPHALAQTLRRYVGPEGVFLSGAWYPQDAAPSPVELEVIGPFNAVTQGQLDVREETKAGIRTRWVCAAPREPLDLVAGPYQVNSLKVGGVDVHCYFYPDDAHLAPHYLKKAGEAIERYSRALGPYPFPSFSIVEHFLPTGYGFPGFTLLGQRVVRLPFIAETSLIHEVVHCWWGNGVRVSERGGNWCEALTSYCADFALAEDKGRAEGRRHRYEALADYAAYARAGNELALSEFKGRHDGVTRAVGYGKGAMVFHMMRRKLGEAVWQKTLQRLVEKQMGKEISWFHIRVTAEMLSNQKVSLGAFTKQWVGRKGAPLLAILGAERKGNTLQVQLAGGNEESWSLDLPVRLETPDGVWQRDVPVTVGKEPSTFEISLPSEGRVQVLELDPDYDVFRRLLPQELPVAIRRVLGAPQVTIVLPDPSDPNFTSYEQLAQQLAPRIRARIVPAARGFAQPGAIVLGESKLAQRLRRRLRGGALRSAAGYSCPEGAVIGPSAGMVASVPIPSTGAALLVEGRSPAAIHACRKLVHYGRYELLLFQGEEARVQRRAQLPAASPLTWSERP